MKFLISTLTLLLFTQIAEAQTSGTDLSKPDTAKKIQVVEISCGQCKFHLKGKGCDLAVRINGKAYFLDGADIDAFGDAHASDGFCKAIRKAEVQGEIVKKRFKVTYIKLLPPQNN